MDVYSATLGLALAAAFAALALAWLRRRGSHRLCVACWVFAAASILYHLFEGHAPGSTAALGPLAFVANHPAPYVAAGIALAAWFLPRLRP